MENKIKFILFLLLTCILFCGFGVCYIDPQKPWKDLLQTTQEIGATPTTVNITNNCYASIIPIDGSIRIDVTGGTPTTKSPLVQQNEICLTGYVKNNSPVIKAYSTGSASVNIAIIESIYGVSNY